MRKKYEFSLEYIQIMDEKAKIDREIMPKPILTDNQIKEIFSLMLKTRIFDNKAVKLQRTGRMGTYASSYGEEAAVIVPSTMINKTDWIVPSYREQGAWIQRGYPLDKILLYYAGSEQSMSVTKEHRILPICVPVGTHVLHAAGLGWGLKKAGKKEIVLCYFGDGATSEGDFHEGMNFASVYKAPVIFFCRNNQYAISVSRDKQTGSKTLAQKAIAYGIKSIQVDGNDIFALAYAMKEALKHARKGEPYMIEAVTYRLSDHTTSDDEKRYRSRKEVRQWLEKEPMKRLVQYMKENKLWTKKYEEKLSKKFDKEIEEAIKKEEAEEEKPKAIFEYVFAEPTSIMKKDLEKWQKKQ